MNCVSLPFEFNTGNDNAKLGLTNVKDDNFHSPKRTNSVLLLSILFFLQDTNPFGISYVWTMKRLNFTSIHKSHFRGLQLIWHLLKVCMRNISPVLSKRGTTSHQRIRLAGNYYKTGMFVLPQLFTK